MAEPLSFDSLIPDQPSPQQQAPQSFDAMEDDEDKYGGVTGMAKSFGLGVLRGASFNASDLALVKSGLVSPETIKAYQSVNPGSSIAGEVAGVAGSMAVAPELSPAGLVGKLGKVSTEAAEKLGLPIAGQALEAMGLGGSSAAARVAANLSNIGSHAAGSAVEGAIYGGVGNTVNEYALGDPDLNAQKIAANFGYGALMGGAVGGILKSAEIGIPESLKAAKSAIGDLKNKLMGTGEGGIEGGGLVNKGLDFVDGSGKLSDAWGSRMKNLNTDQQQGIVDDVSKQLNTINNNLQTTLKDFNGKIRPAAVDALIDTADKTKVIHGQQDVIDHVLSAIDEIKSNPGLYDQNAAAKLDKFHTQLVEGLKEGNDPADIFNRTREVQQKISSWGQGVVANTQTADTKALLNGIAGKMNEYLKNPDVFGVVGSNLAEHNQMLQKVYEFTPPFGKKSNFTTDWMTNAGTRTAPRLEIDPKKVARIFKSGDQVKIQRLNDWFDTIKQLPDHIENTMANVPNEGMDQKLLANIEDSHDAIKAAQSKYQENAKNMKGSALGMGDIAAASLASSHPVIGGMLELYNLASQPLKTINKLAEIENIVNKTTNVIGKGAKAIFENTSKALDASTGIISKLSTQSRLDNHQDLHNQIAAFQADPGKLADKLGEATEKLHDAAPNISQSLQSSAIRATQFLQSKLPIKSDSNPFSEPYKPSLSEMAKFERYQSVVEKPMIALEQVKNRTITPETIEALSAVYPKLLDQMRQAVQLEAQKAVQNGPLPFQLKQSLSMFLGTPLSPSLEYQNVMNNQMAFQPAPEPQPKTKGSPKPSVVSMRDMKPQNRMSLTATDNDEA